MFCFLRSTCVYITSVSDAHSPAPVQGLPFFFRLLSCRTSAPSHLAKRVPFFPFVTPMSEFNPCTLPVALLAEGPVGFYVISFLWFSSSQASVVRETAFLDSLYVPCIFLVPSFCGAEAPFPRPRGIDGFTFFTFYTEAFCFPPRQHNYFGVSFLPPF